jgi:alpha/beta superfamily hydrolase
MESIRFTTSDNVELAADLLAHPSPVARAVVTHPHPLYGGDRHNPVVDTVFRALHDHGVSVLRFNFRGVGTSEGTHGEGVSERLDVMAAINTVVAEGSDQDLPLLLCGYSFGADVALAVDHDAVRGWFVVAPPLAIGSDFTERTDPRPVHIAAASNDQFRSADAAVEATSSWPQVEVHEITGADHFFAGHTAALVGPLNSALGAIGVA